MQRNTRPPSIVSKLSKATTLLAVFATSLSGSLLSAKMDIGQNLPDVTPHNTIPFFVNLMKHSHPWRTQNADGTGDFDTEFADQIPLQQYNGYPTRLPYSVGGKDQIVHTQVPVFVDGTHKLTVVGRGEILLSYPGSDFWETYTISGGSSNTIYIEVSGVNNPADFREGSAERVGASHIGLRIMASDASNPIKDIQIMPPGYHDAGRDDFHDAFKDLIEPFTVIRFMNWQRINGSPVTTNNRDTNRKDYYTQATVDGVAIDHIIDLANELRKDIWVCVPHKMENAGGLAYQIATKLDPGITCYVEYSNEVWNGGGLFPQGQWVEENTEGENRHQKYGTRADAAFRSFRTQFQARRGSLSDLRCVLAGQTANIGVLNEALITGGEFADSLAIAPYFGTVFRDAHLLAVKEKGEWALRSSLSGYYGANYLDDLNEKTNEEGKPIEKSVIFRPILPSTGNYRVDIRYPASGANAASVPVTILHDEGKTTVNVDQRGNGGTWNSLGTFRFNSGTYHDVTISTKNTTGRVVADAIRFVPQGGGPAIIVDNADDRVFIPTLDELANTATWAHVPVTGLARHRDLSIETGIPLIAYEGGQHFVGARGTDIYPELTDQLLTFNRNWRMKNLYRDVYLDAVNEHGLDLFVHFHLVGQWSKFGSWGAMEFYTQPITPSAAGKAWALLDWMDADSPPPPPPPSGSNPVIDATFDNGLTVASGSWMNSNDPSEVGTGWQVQAADEPWTYDAAGGFATNSGRGAPAMAQIIHDQGQTTGLQNVSFRLANQFPGNIVEFYIWGVNEEFGVSLYERVGPRTSAGNIADGGVDGAELLADRDRNDGDDLGDLDQPDFVTVSYDNASGADNRVNFGNGYEYLVVLFYVRGATGDGEYVRIDDVVIGGDAPAPDPDPDPEPTDTILETFDWADGLGTGFAGNNGTAAGANGLQWTYDRVARDDSKSITGVSLILQRRMSATTTGWIEAQLPTAITGFRLKFQPRYHGKSQIRVTVDGVPFNSVIADGHTDLQTMDETVSAPAGATIRIESIGNPDGTWKDVIIDDLELLGTDGSGGGGGTTLQPTDDHNTTTGDGTSDTTSAVSKFARFVMKFDLGSVSSVQSATLRVYRRDSDTAANTVEAYAGRTDDWYESSPNADIPIETGGVLDSVNSPGGGQWLAFDVTDLVAAEAAGDGTATLVLRTLTGTWNTFVHTRQNSTNPPELVINGGGS